MQNPIAMQGHDAQEDQRFYAHTPEDGGPWEVLFTPFGSNSGECGQMECSACESMAKDHGHLNKVAYWTSRFAREMFPLDSVEAAHASEWGYVAGLWHDLGKFAPIWQSYLRAKATDADPHTDEVHGKVDHSSAGAQHSDQHVALFGKLLAYVIAGHHAGLTNGIDDTGSSLEKRLMKELADYSTSPASVLAFASHLGPPPFVLESSHSLAFFVRMIFSCLVDADFLTTEAFMSSRRSSDRRTVHPSIEAMEGTLDRHLARFGTPDTPVNHGRASVLESCLDKATRPPGLFSLTVPTGGGKTLSSLAFALKHARVHNLRRVIYVIPYTSIIEQNAAVFREALAELGADIVLEHHSNLDIDAEHSTTSSRLSAENWDARLIVTTNVQFFESLHSNRASRSRKLHRVARSVVVLDEAQLLPVELLKACLMTIDELTSNYHSTVVLCTATQPALHRRDDFPIGLPSPTEIVPEPRSLYSIFRRVEAIRLGRRTDAEIVERMLEYDQALCIVNTRRHARLLFDELPRDGASFHLSALMCPEHRTARLSEVKDCLDSGKPVRVVSTQLIEAGVDIDFPVVFRALAGLDSIAQAAGRCDREGRLTENLGRPGGRLHIFEPESMSSPGVLRSMADSAREVIATIDGDLLGLDAIEAYFRTHYWKQLDNVDRHHINDCWPPNPPARMTREDELLLIMFRRCADSFRLIDDYSQPVIIPYGKRGDELCDELRRAFDPSDRRRTARKLQRYTVSIPPMQHSRLLRAGILETVHVHFHILNSTGHYDKEFGLHPDPDLMLSADHSII